MEIAITAALRSPIAPLMGDLSSLTAPNLGAKVLRAAMAQAAVSVVDEVILGHVLTAGVGQGPARQAAKAAGLPDQTTAFTLNQICGSGLRAVALGAQQILSGQGQSVLAGGQESMSQAPHAQHLRQGHKFGNVALIDTMSNDGLTDAFAGTPMGITAETIAERWALSREAQDAFALESQRRAAAAQARGDFDAEICPITVPNRKGDTIVDQDTSLRAGTTAASLACLRPVFKSGGTVTAGNASGINDGAAIVALMDKARVDAGAGQEVFATIKSFATAGVPAEIMGTGPIPASHLALRRAGWTVADLDLIESNEAFAAQALCVMGELGLDPALVNVNGGAIALGHPIGASGARVLVTLIHALRARGGGRGLATLCIGGGMGVAMCIEV